jgi:hypothetical protein
MLDARSHVVSGATHSWRSSSQIPPTLLATVTAATVARPAVALAIPTAPGRASRASPALATLAPVPAPTGGLEAEDAPAGEQDGVDLPDDRPRTQPVGVEGARRRAADVHPAHGALRGKHDRAPRPTLRIGPVAD